MNIKCIKVVFLVILFCILVFSLLSCANSGNIFGLAKFWDFSERSSTSEKAINQFVTNVRPHPGNPDSHYLLGYYYQKRGRYKEAIEEFEKAVLIDPDYIKAYNGLGISCDMMGDYEKAREAYKQALRLNPYLGYIYNNIGYSYLLQGNLDEAISAFEKAIAIDSSLIQSYNNLGLAYGKKGDFELAIAAFKSAGHDDQAYYNLALIYYKKGLFKEAAQNYTLALGLNPSFTKAHLGLKAALALSDISEETLHVVALEKNIHYSTMTEQADTVRSKREKNKDLEKIKIEVSNGNGVEGMARRVRDYLNKNGINVVRLTNADRFNYSKTNIYYQKGHYEAAYYIANQIPGVQKLWKTNSNRKDINIKILIGKDLNVYDKKVFRQKT